MTPRCLPACSSASVHAPICLRQAIVDNKVQGMEKLCMSCVHLALHRWQLLPRVHTGCGAHKPLLHLFHQASYAPLCLRVWKQTVVPGWVFAGLHSIPRKIRSRQTAFPPKVNPAQSQFPPKVNSRQKYVPANGRSRQQSIPAKARSRQTSIWLLYVLYSQNVQTTWVVP